jgi:anti-sigma factor RsiW
MADQRNIDLQRYLDGELSSSQARKIRQRLEGSEADRQQLATLEQMGGMLRDSAEAAADEANFDHLWTRVKAGIAEQEPLGLGERLGYWLRRYGVVVATAAAAAVLAVVLIGNPMQEPPARNDAVIESLETGPGAMSTIFTINDPEESGETTVIWVSETSAEEEM